jgi:threonyl-tRNA synthetase
MNRYEDSKLYRIRHSAAHVMAQAVLEKFPDAKIAIGPPIEDGFYYDFDLPRPLTEEDLQAIEQRMRQIIREGHEFVRKEVSADDARHIFHDQPYKLELIDGLEQGGVDEYGEKTSDPVVISTYKQDSFEDLCRGPHVKNTREINPDAVSITFKPPRTGAATSTGRCSRAFMARRGSPPSSLRNTWRCWKSPGSAITA